MNTENAKIPEGKNKIPPYSRIEMLGQIVSPIPLPFKDVVESLDLDSL